VTSFPADLESVVLAALARDRGKRTPSAAHLALALDQFCMRQGLVTGPLVIAHYVRSLFPYERAAEEGMGIAQVPSPGSQTPDSDRAGAVSAEALEERLLAEELRALQRRRSSGAGQERADDSTRFRVDESAEPELEELSADDLVVDEPDASDDLAAAAASAAPRLRIDELDEDSEIKPVVLLSPKRKQSQPSPTSEGAFMSDLERRLREDADS
jgi:hypothetical protein